MKFSKLLIDLEACAEAREWAGNKTWAEVFATCQRGDWLLWLWQKTAADTEDNLRLLTRAKAHCALTVRHLMKDERSINACEVALKFADRLATRHELKDAAYAAYNASASAAASAASSAASASAAAYASAAYAASAAAYASAATRTAFEKQTADIVRQYLPINTWNVTTND